VIHPGAGKEYRQWPADRFAAVADELVRRRAMNICIIGGAGDQPLMDQIIAAMAHRAAAFSLVLPIQQLLALMERATILLSNESGPTHLAAATELPIATIFGPSKEQVWRPIRRENMLVLRGEECDPRCGKRRCYADRKCLMALTPAMMLAAAEQLLSQPPAPVRWANEVNLDTTPATDPALNC
jgi:ADP-heptose:LPS heptosyltransferase